MRASEKPAFTGYLIVVPDDIQLMMPQSKCVPVQEGAADNVKSKRNINIKDLNCKHSFKCTRASFKDEEILTIFTVDDANKIN